MAKYFIGFIIHSNCGYTFISNGPLYGENHGSTAGSQLSFSRSWGGT
jgi:hypothetical protein